LPDGVQHRDPVDLQVLSIKAVQNGETIRYRLTLTDGLGQIYAMASGPGGESIKNEDIVASSVIRANFYMFNNLGGQKLMILMSMDVLQKTSTLLMSEGANPVQQTTGGSSAPPAASTGSSSGAGMNTSYNLGRTYGGARSDGSSSAGAPSGGLPGGSSVNSAPVVGNNQSNLIPIAALNPYSNRWSFKARITNKGDKRSWNNAKGSGTLFSIDVLDKEGSDIKGTFFKESCEKFYPLLQQGHVYVFSGGKLKIASKQYNNTSNQYEITFDQNTTITEVQEDSSIKSVNFNFVKLNEVAQTEEGKIVDVVGYVKDFQECSTIISQKLGGRELKKRDLTIADDTLTEIKLTLWGEKAESENFNWHEHPVVGFKSVKISDYGGKSLGCLNSTNVIVEPDAPEAVQLFEWMKKMVTEQGSLPQGQSLSTGASTRGQDNLEDRLPVCAIKEQGLGHGEKPDYSDFKLSIMFIPTASRDGKLWYDACPNGDCKKKVTEEMSGGWRCEKCNQVFDHCKARYIFSANMGDYSGSEWFSMFDDTASVVMGKSADELKQVHESNIEEYNDFVMRQTFRTFIIRAKTQMENMQDISAGSRLKNSVMSLKPVDYVVESKKILAALAKYETAKPVPVA
jgi:replication factor A1